LRQADHADLGGVGRRQPERRHLRRPGAVAQGYAAGIAVGARAQECVAIDTMRFLCPVRIGDVLCVDTTIEQVGHTSMSIRLRAWALRGPDE
jgi:acyl-CoA hydrolase